jgi:hypothetical protein
MIWRMREAEKRYFATGGLGRSDKDTISDDDFSAALPAVVVAAAAAGLETAMYSVGAFPLRIAHSPLCPLFQCSTWQAELQ